MSHLQGFGVGTAAVGMTISTYALARLMMNLPAGILADRHGRKLLLVWGPAITALGEPIPRPPSIFSCPCYARCICFAWFSLPAAKQQSQAAQTDKP